MRLTKFRVQNYKKINDTGEVKADALTVFVGKNEAGKSAILKGLSKLNPSDGQKYDALKEFPRRRYTNEFAKKKWPIATGHFELDDGTRDEISEACPLLSKVTSCEVTRYSDWSQTVAFDGFEYPQTPAGKTFHALLDKLTEKVRGLTAPDGKGEALGPLKTNVTTFLAAAKKAQLAEGAVNETALETLRNNLGAHLNEAWQQELFAPVTKPLDKLQADLDVEEQFQKARNIVVANVPKFVYFDRYDVLDSAVHVPSFLSQLQSAPNQPRVRTTHCLFKHVGLDIQRVGGLASYNRGQAQTEDIRRQVDERAILLSSASNAMTAKFSAWWEQRKHVFRFDIDGDYLRVWVSDDLDPSEIELDQRSQGMQYFFSFYIVFQVEAADAHENSILLLDEPGANLHGTAQAKVVHFLQKLSAENQVIYTTHSPFMVDIDHLENIRAVYEDEEEDGTTKVSTDVWPRDRDALFPLQAALGYQLVQSLFISKRQVIVEGLTDMWLVKALDHALAHHGRARLRQDVILNPAGGTTRLVPLAAMLMGHEVELAVLLDGDEPGRREGKKITQELFNNDASRTFFIGDFAGRPNAELEDLLPEKMYLDAVKAAYKDVTFDFTPEEKAMPAVVDRIDALLKRKGVGRFEKWRPAQIIRDQILAAPGQLPKETLDTAEKLLSALNSAFK